MDVEIHDETSGISSEELLEFLRNKSNPEILFSGLSKSCCVGFVDIVNSTAITAKLTNGKMCRYYSIFLNAMSKIAKSYNATIVKNLGDSLLYYFPDTEGDDKKSFIKVLDCGLKMIELRIVINLILAEANLPPLDYRISSDYGLVNIATSSNSQYEDMFGPTVNLCSKLNSTARPNSLVIGGDLHQIVRKLKKYEFSIVGEYMLGLKMNYPVYSVIPAKPIKWYSCII